MRGLTRLGRLERRHREIEERVDDAVQDGDLVARLATPEEQNLLAELRRRCQARRPLQKRLRERVRQHVLQSLPRR